MNKRNFFKSTIGSFVIFLTNPFKAFGKPTIKPSVGEVIDTIRDGIKNIYKDFEKRPFNEETERDLVSVLNDMLDVYVKERWIDRFRIRYGIIGVGSTYYCDIYIDINYNGYYKELYLMEYRREF